VPGAALVNGCDACVTAVCAQDPFCCNNTWDVICVNQVSGACGIDCVTNQSSCAGQYSGGPGYYLCEEDVFCQIGANVSATTCDEICEDGGGECIDAYNNDNMCGLGQPYGCGNTQGFNTVICICSRGCGTGAPCSGNQTCVNGQCI